jgi:hypothetical protein
VARRKRWPLQRVERSEDGRTVTVPAHVWDHVCETLATIAYSRTPHTPRTLAQEAVEYGAKPYMPVPPQYCGDCGAMLGEERHASGCRAVTGHTTEYYGCWPWDVRG